MTSIETLLRSAFAIKDELGDVVAEEAIRAARAAMARTVFRRAVAQLSGSCDRKLVTAGIGKAAYRGGLEASIAPPKQQTAASENNVVRPIQPGVLSDKPKSLAKGPYPGMDQAAQS